VYRRGLGDKWSESVRCFGTKVYLTRQADAVELTVAQLVKKFPASRATQEFSLPLSQEPVAVPCPESPASQRIPLESVFNGVHPLPSMSRSWKRSVSLRYAFVMCCMDLNQFVLNVKPAWMPLYLTALLI
jgi:hypothetical protein